MHDRLIAGTGVWPLLRIGVFVVCLSSVLSCVGRAGGSSSPDGGRAFRPATDDARGDALPRRSRTEESGRLLFERYCSVCHGVEGDGFGINAPNLPVVVADLANLDLQAARTDRDLADIISRGGRAVGRAPQMPPWGRTLSLREIDALVAYIRALARPVRRHGLTVDTSHGSHATAQFWR